jgi:hypothetical protein
MARRRKATRTETSTDKIIDREIFSSLMKEVSANKAKISELSGHIGSRIKLAADNNNLHRGAFALMVRMKKMDEVKRNDLYRNIGIYWDICTELGFFGAQTKDMFEAEPDAETDTEKQPTVSELLNEAAAAANEALLTNGIKELNEDDAELAKTVFPPEDPNHTLGDDEPDVRPSFMRSTTMPEPAAEEAPKPKRGRKKGALEGANAEGSYSAVN